MDEQSMCDLFPERVELLFWSMSLPQTGVPSPGWCPFLGSMSLPGLNVPSLRLLSLPWAWCPFLGAWCPFPWARCPFPGARCPFPGLSVPSPSSVSLPGLGVPSLSSVSLPWSWCPFPGLSVPSLRLLSLSWTRCPLFGLGVPSLGSVSLWIRHSQASGFWLCVQALPWCFSHLEVERIYSKGCLSCTPCAPGGAARSSSCPRGACAPALSGSAQGWWWFNFGSLCSSSASVTQGPCPLSGGVCRKLRVTTGVAHWQLGGHRLWTMWSVSR